MKVVHVVPSRPYGGVQRLVAQLAEHQRRRGADVEVIAVYSEPRFLAELNRRNVPALEVRGDRPTSGAARKFLKYLDATRPEIVHLHMGVLWSNALGWLRKREIWLAHIHNYPDSGPGGPRGNLLRFVNRRLSDAYVGVSRSVSEAIGREMGSLKRPIFTVYNGVPEFDPVAVSPSRPKRATYGMATRFASDKGVAEFLVAAEHIVRLQPSARFRLAGDGPLLPWTRDQIAKRGLGSIVELVGHVSDVNAFWRSIDLALFTAPREPFGLRIVEPMALGIPVIAFRTGSGSDEILADGLSTAMVPWADYAALASRAVQVTETPELWQMLSDSGVHVVRSRFSLSRMTRDLESIYSDLLRMSSYKSTNLHDREASAR